MDKYTEKIYKWWDIDGADIYIGECKDGVIYTHWECELVAQYT